MLEKPCTLYWSSDILPSYLFGQPCLFGQYENGVIGKPAHVLISRNFTLQYFKSQQIKENAKENLFFV